MCDRFVLSTEGKTFIGAGKVMHDCYSDDYNIPHLHFLVSKLENGLYEACNLEFSLFALGDSKATAVAELVELTIKHIDGVLEYGRGFSELQETAIRHTMDNYWAKYREIEFIAASQKQDIGHNVAQQLTNAIRSIMSEKIREEIIKVAKEEAKTLMNKFLFNLLYQEINRAA